MMTIFVIIMMPAALRAVIPRSFWPPSGLHPVNPRVSWWCSGIPVWPLACGGGMLPEGRRGMLFFSASAAGSRVSGGAPASVSGHWRACVRQWWCSGIRVWPLACASVRLYVPEFLPENGAAGWLKCVCGFLWRSGSVLALPAFGLRLVQGQIDRLTAR